MMLLQGNALRIPLANCECYLVLGDPDGESVVTFYCVLPAGHTGPHEEADKGAGLNNQQAYKITWWEATT